MKPKDVKIPFSFKDRKVFLENSLFCVPPYLNSYEAFLFDGFSSPEVFGNDNEVFVEYCSGNGKWIVERAKNNPGLNFVACEKQFLRARKILSKCKNERLSNLLVVCAEGYTVTKHYFPDQSVSGIFVNFPDPWPKKRHSKHRLITPLFIQEIKRVLKPHKEAVFVTDDEATSSRMIETCTEEKLLPKFPSPHFIDLPIDYGSSFFEKLWREKGKTLRYHVFQNS